MDNRERRYRLAVDTGGTFSDFVLLDQQSGDFRVFKVSSTPEDPGKAVLEGLENIARGGVPASAVNFFVHGTTVCTNALLEEKGARAGLVITEGFRGVYEVQEQAREYGPVLFDLFFEKPSLLIPQSRTFEVKERVGAGGEVDEPLDEASVEAAIEGLEREGVNSVAICLLFSFANPAHESRIAEKIKERHPEWMVTASCDLLPQIREYYRLSTTAINAFIGPRLLDYLSRLGGSLSDSGLSTPQTYVMQSNGGAATFPAATERGVTTILSGPAGGVVAGVEIGRLAQLPNVITFDMGGTSCDVSLAEGGDPQRAMRSIVDGRHIAVPSLDIHTVSAGGGTLAWVDEQGGLHVGPQSAGAAPGPVAYGRGGETPTVTDCDLVLGYLNPASFLGGGMALDVEAARRAVEEKIARPLGIDVYRAAEGVVQIVNVKMGEAVKAISTQRGYDLRDFALVPFGGAGPVHGSQIALDLGIGTVVVPLSPGVASALGLLMCPVRHDYVVSRLRLLSECTPEEVEGSFAPLEERATAELAAEGFGPGKRYLEYLIDLRYAGQGYEISIPVPGSRFATEELASLRNHFDQVHEQRYGHAAPTQPVEVVSYRVTGIGEVQPAELATVPPMRDGVDSSLIEEREVFFSGSGACRCPIYDRSRLGAGVTLDGPAVIEQYDSTVVVHPEQSLRVDDYGNLILERRDTGRPESGFLSGRGFA